MHRSRIWPVLGSAALLLALAGQAHAQMAAIASRMGSMRGRNGQFPPDMDWDAIDDDSGNARMRGMRDPSAEQDPAAALKTDLGKALRTMEFGRDAQRALDARVKLAERRRKEATAPYGPPTPEADDLSGGDGDESADGGDEMEGMPAALRAMAAARGAKMNAGADAGEGSAAEKAREKQFAQKMAKRAADRFRLMVVAGDWDAVGQFLHTEAKEDASAIYTLVLQRLTMQDNALVPDDVLELSDAAPEAPSEKQIALLGGLLKATARRGAEPAAVAARIAQGTKFLGGPADGPADQATSRADNRKRTAGLLIAAGLTVEAQAYMAPLAEAKANEDVELLNLYTIYFNALASKKEGSEKEAVYRQGWDVAREALALPSTPDQRRKSLSMVLRMAAHVEDAPGDEWLRSLFPPNVSAAEGDLGWMVIEKVCSRAQMLREMQAPPAVRSRQLQFVQRVGKAILASVKDQALPDVGVWTPGLNMLTSALLDEAELARQLGDQQQQNEYNPYGYNPYGRNQEPQLQPVPLDELEHVLPDERWLLAIDPGLSAKLELLLAAAQGNAGDFAAVLDLIRPIVPKDPARAEKLAEALLKAWPTYTGHASSPAANSYIARRSFFNPFMFGGGYDGGGGIPLTRAQQTRHLDKLHGVLTDLASMHVGPLPVGLVVDAFSASHSPAEVFRADDIAGVFGPVDSINRETRLKLADAMRLRLAGMWRNQQVQQEAGTKRSEQDVAKEVMHGYDVAMSLVPPPDDAPLAYQSVLALADLKYDKAEYLYGRKVDLATYNGLRGEAFDLYKNAAQLYVTQVAAAKVPPSARPFSQWFNAALGASDLGFLTKQDQADTEQIEAVKAALAALPASIRAEHAELFAKATGTSLSEVNPELKYVYAQNAVKLVGDTPAGRDVRKELALYDDLTKEVQLNVGVDGSTSVGHTEPFGVVVSVWSTVSVSRESGGFGKYVNPQVWDPSTGQQSDNKEKLDKKLREALSDKFEVVSTTFSKPDVKPMPLEGGGREGWEQTPLAYVLLKAKDPSVDRLPEVKIEMDFRDQSGQVLLPVTSTSLQIDARQQAADARAIDDLALDVVLDDRTYEQGSPASARTPQDGSELPKPGDIALEVHAKGAGLIPDLSKVLDLASIKGFTVLRTDDPGNSIAELQTRHNQVVPISERSWTVHLRADRGPAGTVAGRTFNFPALQAAFSGAKMDTKRYNDADVVAAKGPITLPPVRQYIWWWVFAAAAVVLAAIGAVVAILVRAMSAKPMVNTGPRFTMPETVTPISTIAVLRQIHALNGQVLTPADQGTLAGEISSLEHRYFAPGPAPTVDETELSGALQRWISKAERGL